MFSWSRFKFLKRVYFYQVRQGHPYVRESLLQSDLSLNYKQLHHVASFWKAKGCLEFHVERGGLTEYTLTSLGMMEVEVGFQKIKHVGIGVAVGLCLFLAFFLYFRLF